MNYASSGNGTIVHLTSEAFKAQAGLFITHIPYRGTALAVPDLVSNKVQLLFDNIVSGLPVNESGLPGFESNTWFGIYAPKGLSADLAARLNAEFNKAMQSAEVQERLAKLGAEPAGNATADEFAAMVRSDSARWGRIIKDRKISIE